MIQLLVAYYVNAGEADAALERLISTRIATVDTVILSKDEYGNVIVNDMDDPDAGKGALFGAFVGGLLGLLTGPAGAIIGATVGAATGGLAAGVIDSGINNQQLQAITQRMDNNTSALITMLFDHDIVTATEALNAPLAQIVRYNLRMELAEEESA
jgi:uncharacterized membrane protein